MTSLCARFSRQALSMLLSVALMLTPVFNGNLRADETKDLTAGSNTTTTAKDKDPLNMSTGEFFFFLDLFALGGRLPLDYRLYYGSLNGVDYTNDGMGTRFSSNQRAGLTRYKYPDYNAVLMDLGSGRELGFNPTARGWQANILERIRYQLIETTDYFYLMDPETQRVTTFQKIGGSQYVDYAVIARVEDCNGNALSYEYGAGYEAGPTRVSDGLGRELRFTYGPVLGNPRTLTRVEDQTGRTCQFSYITGPAGPLLQSITDPEGRVTTFDYTGESKLTRITRPKGNAPYSQAYATPGSWASQVVSQTDAYGSTTLVQANSYNPYAGSQSKFTLTNPDGTTASFIHDHEYRVLKSITDAAGKTITCQTPAATDRIDGVTERLGHQLQFAYHGPSGLLASITNPAGHVLGYEYSSRTQTFAGPAKADAVTFTFWDLARINYPDGSDERFTVDDHGNTLTRTDPVGQTWTYTYNAWGQEITVTNPAGGVISKTYNSDGTMASRQDPDTGLTTFGYDGRKRLSQVTYQNGTTYTADYDLRDRITSLTDGNGHTFTFHYDENGNLIRETDPAGQSRQYAYDLLDRPATATDRQGKESSFSYDSMDRYASFTNPNGLATTFAYDPRGWLRTVSRGGRAWQTEHTGEGAPSGRISPQGLRTAYQLNALGRPEGITDPAGETTQLAWDSRGRITGFTDPLGRSIQFRFDPRGLLDRITAPDQSQVNIQWNNLGRFTGITDQLGNTWQFGYTGMGRMVSRTDPLNRSWAYGYDAAGRLNQVVYPDGSIQQRATDGIGNVTEKQFADTTLHFTYDPLDHLISTENLALGYDVEERVIRTTRSGTDFGATYDDGGRLRTVTYNGGALTVTYSYDPVTGQLNGVSDDVSRAGITFSYDGDGRLTGIGRNNAVNSVFDWDDAGRLVGIRDGSITDLRCARDAAGQITDVEMSAPLDPAEALPGGTLEMTFDAAAQIDAPGYAYDLRGRLTAAPGHAFQWDGASRLTGVDGATLTYNGVNDLASRSEGPETIQYFTNHAIATHPIVAERAGAEGPFLRYYVWTPAGRLLYSIDAAAGNPVRYYHFDFTGSTLALTDAAGTVTDAYAYAPYGELLAHHGDSPQPFTFVGQEGVRREGASSTLYQMGMRYFDAATGRFLSPDPDWPKLGDPYQLNPYQYAAGNPVSVTDARGRLLPFLVVVVSIATLAFGILVGGEEVKEAINDREQKKEMDKVINSIRERREKWNREHAGEIQAEKARQAREKYEQEQRILGLVEWGREWLFQGVLVLLKEQDKKGTLNDRDKQWLRDIYQALAICWEQEGDDWRASEFRKMAAEVE